MLLRVSLRPLVGRATLLKLHLQTLPRRHHFGMDSDFTVLEQEHKTKHKPLFSSNFSIHQRKRSSSEPKLTKKAGTVGCVADIGGGWPIAKLSLRLLHFHILFIWELLNDSPAKLSNCDKHRYLCLKNNIVAQIHQIACSYVGFREYLPRWFHKKNLYDNRDIESSLCPWLTVLRLVKFTKKPFWYVVFKEKSYICIVHYLQKTLILVIAPFYW
jgi:hypothetical protein